MWGRRGPPCPMPEGSVALGPLTFATDLNVDDFFSTKFSCERTRAMKLSELIRQDVFIHCVLDGRRDLPSLPVTRHPLVSAAIMRLSLSLLRTRRRDAFVEVGIPGQSGALAALQFGDNLRPQQQNNGANLQTDQKHNNRCQ